MIPIISVHPQLRMEFMLVNAKIISKIPPTKKPIVNKIVIAKNVFSGVKMHHIPSITANNPINTDIHQFFTALLNDDCK